MRSLRELFVQPSREAKVEAPVHIPPPPPIPAHEKRELRQARIRIGRKWQVMDMLLADYRAQDRFLGHR